MGASKTHQYDQSELFKAKLALALGHPAWIRIMKILSAQQFTRNVDLITDLQLSKSTVNNHLMKLYQAGLIDVEFGDNCYHIRHNHKLVGNLPNYFELN